MKFTDEQKEVLALLPNEVKESNELTDAAKLILANLMLLNGTDFAKNEGYLFRTNQALKEDTGIKSEKTIIAAVNKLIELGFIERKAGQRKAASEYRLNTVKIQEYTVKIHCKNENYSNKLQYKNYSKKLQYKEKNTVINYSNKLQYNDDEISLIINELQNTVNKLQYKITVIEYELLQYKNYSIKNYSENKNYSTDIDIDKEIESETNDNNNNTEEYNIKDQNKKKIITKDNLEILKENSTVEIPNDEDIQRENKILNEIENTSKDNLLGNENLNSENNIPSDEKDNSKVESSKDEISNDENTLNENYDISILENMYFNEGPSVESQINEMPKDNPPLDIDSMEREFWGESTEYRAMNSSKENEDLKENSKDENSNDENSKDNEILEYSIFGDEIPQDNENQNTVKFIDGKFQVVEQVKNKINLNLSEMKNSKEKSQTIENVKTVKGEISNDLNSSKENENFNVFGKLQSYRDMNSGRVEGYQFNAYDNLTAAKDYSKSFHAAIINLTIESSELKASVSDTGTWGMLSRKNGVYSFIASNTDLSDGKYIAQQHSLSLEKKGGAAADNENASNNALQGTEITEVDNYTAEGEKVAPVQSPIVNKASEGNTDTTADSKDNENTSNNADTAVKMSQVDNHTTKGEIIAPAQSPIANKASDEKIDTTAEWNNIELFIITSNRTVRSLIEELSEIPVTNLESFSLAYSALDYQMSHKYKQTMTSDEWNSFTNTLKNVTDRFFRHWAEVFSTRQPSSNFYEQQMYGLVQNNHQQSTATVNDTSNNAPQAPKTADVDNYTTDTEKIDSTQSPIANKASDSNVDACYDMYGISTDELNDIIGHHNSNGKGAWRNMTIKLHNEETTISKALDHFKDKKGDGNEFMECNTFLYYFTPICYEVEKLLKTKTMTDEQYQDFLSIIGKLTRGKFAYWRKVFTTRPPRPNFPSEQEMWKLLRCPQVTNKTVNKNTDNVVNNNKVYEDNVILPREKDFESMNLDDIKNTLLTFVQEHPNLSDDKKKYINDLCIAYTLDPQYVA